MTACVYGIYNTVTDKWYVGSTKNQRVRLYRHMYRLDRQRHHSPKLQNSWTKYGPDAFRIYILEAVEEDRRLQVEQEYIDRLAAYTNGYNARPVAESPLGTKLSEQHRRKISEKLKGKPKSAEHVEKVAAAQRGVARPKTGPMSEKQRQNVSLAIKEHWKLRRARELAKRMSTGEVEWANAPK